MTDTETTAIQTIEAKRTAMAISLAPLCAQAGVGRQTYYDALAGITVPTKATIVKLNQALTRFRLASASPPALPAAVAAYRCALLVAGSLLGVDMRAALWSDPSRKATSDRDWLEEARARRLAYWISNGLLGFSVSDVGRAAGVSKQAVSIGVREIEDDVDLDVVRGRLEEIFRPMKERT